MNSKATFQVPLSTVAQITQLADMPIEELKALWRSLYQQDPPTHVRTFLERKLAFRLQELAFKQQEPERHAKLQNNIQALMIDSQKPSTTSSEVMPGTVLTRLYQGKEYQVTATHDGQYEFEGRLYSSLSVIAREITGTRWSGPLFFGLRRKISNSSKKKRTS